MSDPIAINDCSYLSGRAVFSGGRWRPTLILALWYEAKDGLGVVCLCTELASMPSCRTIAELLSYYRATTELPSYYRAATELPSYYRAAELTSYYHRGRGVRRV
ncbi:hypothetical protein AAC387_Pa01g2689 [Persea americana]